MSQTAEMSRRFFSARMLWFFLVVSAASASALAQGSPFTIAGIVEDSSGARIPDAKVKLINTVSGAENDAVTGQDGSFVLLGVLPGLYSLQIVRPGFATAQITGLSAGAGEAKNLLIRLHVGSVTETIEIAAEGVTLDASGAAIQTALDRKFMSDVPVNGRSFQDLITMTPGVVTQNPQALGGGSGPGGLSINGQRADANYIMIDGVSGNFGPGNPIGTRKVPSAGNLIGLTAIGTTQALASVDALQEFHVLSSTYSAEFGTAPGGQFNLVTRSGAGSYRRAIHGSVYNYRRYNLSDSIDWFEGLIQQKEKIYSAGWSNFINYHQNDIGGTLESPLILPGVPANPEKTFLFLSYEELHSQEPTAFQEQFVPRNSSGCFPYPSCSNLPMSLWPILEDFPASYFRNASPSAILGPYASYWSMPSSLHSLGIRLDHRISPNTSLFFRYNNSPSDIQSINLSSLTLARSSSQTATLGVSTQFSASKADELRIGIAHADANQTTSISPSYSLDVNSSTITNLLFDLGDQGFPAASGQFYMHIPGYGESAIDVDQASNSLRQWNLRDTFSIQAGAHLWRFGIDERHIASAVNPAPLSVEADFFDQNALLSNLASAVSVTARSPATPIFNEFSAFAQDEWRLSKSLTLSPGLRWELDPAPHGSHSQDAYTLLGNVNDPPTLQLAPRGTALWRTDWLSFAPRMGVAWTVHGSDNWETVVRGGGGIFFNSANPQAAEAFTGFGFSSTIHATYISVPIPSNLFELSPSPGPYTNSLIYAFPQNMRLPYAAQWSVAVEQQLGKTQAVTASYVGAGGQRLLQEQRININSRNPNFGEIISFPGGITSNYQSLQLKFQRSIAPGVQALASYGWSHTLDFGSTDPEFLLVRSNSDVDVRQNLQAAITWDEHPRDGRWFERYIVGGWAADGRVTARTGYPVNLEGNLFSDPATGERYFSGVDLIPGRPLYLYDSQYPGGRIFNGGPNATNPAFVLPTGLSAGNAPRNQLRDFGSFQINSDIRRELHLYRGYNLQLRAEAFNLFNHPTLGYIDPCVTDALFGQPTLLLNQSFGSAGSLYEPGGPRSLQFSAKIRF